MDFAFPVFFFLLFGCVFLLQLVFIAFWIWMIVDCVQNEPAGDDSKVVWILVIVLANWVGALIYYFVRRPERMQRYGR